MKITTLQESINNATQKIALTKEQLFRLSDVLEPVTMEHEISRTLDKALIEVTNAYGKMQTFVNFESSKKIICSCFLNGFPISIISIENVLYSAKEFTEKFPEYKTLGDIKEEKAFPIDLIWFNPNFPNISPDAHSMSQVGIIANVSRYLEIKENFATYSIEAQKMTVSSNSPLVGNRQTRRKNKKKGQPEKTTVIKKVQFMSFPEPDIIEKTVMKRYNMTKRVVKEHSRRLRNGQVKTFPRKVYYKIS